MFSATASILISLWGMLPLPAPHPATAECARVAANIRPRTTPRTETKWLAGAARLLEKAYPGLRLRYEDSLYVIDRGTAHTARVHYDHDQESGYAALVLIYSSKHVAALRSGEAMSGDGCRSSAELVLARVGATGAPQIVARTQLDDEAVAIDVRTIDVDVRDGEPSVRFLYFAYYGAPGWFGYVGWRAEVSVERGRLVTDRLPASYLKVSRSGPHRMEGYLAPAAGGSRSTARLTVAAFGSKGEVEREFDVPLVAGRFLSGAKILERVP